MTIAISFVKCYVCGIDVAVMAGSRFGACQSHSNEDCRKALAELQRELDNEKVAKS